MKESTDALSTKQFRPDNLAALKFWDMWKIAMNYSFNFSAYQTALLLSDIFNDVAGFITLPTAVFRKDISTTY